MGAILRLVKEITYIMKQKKYWKKYRLSPETEEVVNDHVISYIKRTGKMMTKQEMANRLILKAK